MISFWLFHKNICHQIVIFHRKLSLYMLKYLYYDISKFSFYITGNNIFLYVISDYIIMMYHHNFAQLNLILVSIHWSFLKLDKIICILVYTAESNNNPFNKTMECTFHFLFKTWILALLFTCAWAMIPCSFILPSLL